MNHENEVEQLNIAICDDEENIRIYIRKLIQKQEPFCKITEFSSGKELLEFQDETNDRRNRHTFSGYLYGR
mgnify:CR=1 FL=1